MARQVCDDPLGEQDTPGGRVEGPCNILDIEERQAPFDLPGSPTLDWQLHRLEAVERSADPILAVLTRDRERAGLVAVAYAKIDPKPLPGGIGVAHHGRVAGHGAVGEADEAVLVDR